MRGSLLAAGLLGATGVALGAYGAHGLEGLLESSGFETDSIPHRLDNFQTGVRYQLHTAAALLALAAISDGAVCGRGRRVATALFTVGAVVFCGLLYVLAITGDGWRWLGAVVPLGGLSLIGAWAVLAAEALIRRACPVAPDTPSGEEALRAELIRLEEVITHQQQLVQELNGALTDARIGADETARRQQAIEQTVKRLVDLQQAAEDLPDERPPHY